MQLLTERIQQRRKGFSLEGDFYNSPEFYKLDMERIFFRQWLYAGHVSLIPNVGDFFTMEIDGESIIISRAESGVHAFFNVCRHRGARLVQKTCGSTRAFVCPYHHWTYGIEGELRQAPHMPKSLCKADYGLPPVWVEEWQGLIYINLSPQKPTETVAERLAVVEREIQSHDLSHTKIIKTHQYTVPANWKLIMENYRECYHCRAAHPQFVATVPVKQLEANRGQTDSRPLKTNKTSFTKFPLREGAVSQTVDGAGVSTPLGVLRSTDTLVHSLVFYPGHAWVFGLDYGMAYGLAPQSEHETQVTAHWYVNERAVEKKDYDPEKVAEFWDITNRQDWFLSTINQQGIRSRRYTPGPYSPDLEDDVEHFVNSYLEMLSTP
jgi:Rieske 2Fe-2S family protein